MQSRRQPARSHRPWQVHPELDQFLAEVDRLLPPPDARADRLSAGWPAPVRPRPLFPFGVFAPRARLHG